MRLRLSIEKDVRETLQRGYLLAIVPFDSPARRKFHGISIPYLLLPPDTESLDRVMGWIGYASLRIRENATRMLVNYPGEKTVSSLKRLLKDESIRTRLRVDSNGHDEEVITYPVRQAAYDVLRALNVPTSKPKGYQGKED